VLVVRDRHGEAADCILHGTSAEQIGSVLTTLLNKDVILCTDGMPAYKQIAKHAKIVHHPVNKFAPHALRLSPPQDSVVLRRRKPKMARYADFKNTN